MSNTAIRRIRRWGSKRTTGIQFEPALRRFGSREARER